MKIKKLNRPEDFRKDQVIFTTDWEGNESVDRVKCVDNGRVFSEPLRSEDPDFTPVALPWKDEGEAVEDFFNRKIYQSVHEIVED